MDERDSQLLQYAEYLCNRLNLKMHVTRIAWLDRLIFRRLNSDDCRFGFGSVIFPERMKGRLELEDWKPIMASSLIFQKRLVWRMPASYLLTIPILFVVTLIGVGVAMLFGHYEDLAFSLFLLLVDGPILVNRATQARKKRRLEADVEAARVVGSEELLSVLRKIDALGLAYIKRTGQRRFSRHFSSKPSVAERIANLSSK